MTLILLYVLAALFVGWTCETFAPRRPLLRLAPQPVYARGWRAAT